MSQLIEHYQSTSHEDDQGFLGEIVFPKVKDNYIAHDSACCERFPNSHPFPTRRIGWEHCGSVLSEAEAPRPGDAWWFLNYKQGQKTWEAPMKCRLHPDWTHG